MIFLFATEQITIMDFGFESKNQLFVTQKQILFVLEIQTGFQTRPRTTQNTFGFPQKQQQQQQHQKAMKFLANSTTGRRLKAR